MATVNLLSNSWQTSKEISSITVNPTSTYVEFKLSTSGKRGDAKACIAIDASKYKSISFKYSKVSHSGITDLKFGVFNNMTATDVSGKMGISEWGDFDIESGGSVTINISTLSGTKYVGFWFYGNSNGGTARDKPYITSLTAVTRGYTLTYNANGGSGGPSNVTNITSTTISSTKPTRSGYDFLGWSKSSTATSASYVAGNSISLNDNTTLYAVWRKFYTVTYNANGGSNAPSSGKKINGQTLTLSTSAPTPPANSSIAHTVTLDANGGTCDQYMITANHVVTYKFTNWNTKADGSGTSYQPGGSYTDNNNVTLYAQYSSTITYNSVSLPTPIRDNYDFLGWSTDEYNLSGIIGEYTPTDTEDVTLYAIWKIRGQVYICDKLGGFSPYKVLIYDGSGWNQYVPYIYTYSGWEIYSG